MSDKMCLNIGFVAGLVYFLGLVVFLSTKQPVVKVDEKQRIYYTKFGGMYCAGHEITQCGLRLIKCGDDRGYECMQDVAIKEAE